MNEARGITRRFVAVGGLVAAVVPGWLARASEGHQSVTCGDALLAARKLLRAVAGDAGRFDALHIAGAGQGAEVGDLLDALLGGLAIKSISLSTPSKLRAIMARRVRADFASGRTEIVQDWILSHTERDLARLSALITKTGHS